MRGNPPGHLVLEALRVLARNPDQWYTAETMRGGTDRTAASLANSAATAVRHNWVERRQVGKYPYYRITGLGLAEVRLAAGQGRDDTRQRKSLDGEPAPTAPGDGSPRRSPGLPGATAPRGAQPFGPGQPECDCGASMISGGMASAHLNSCASLRPRRPRWMDHDPLCMMRRNLGHARCSCSASCRCRACVRNTELAWLLAEIAVRFPDGLDRLEALASA